MCTPSHLFKSLFLFGMCGIESFKFSLFLGFETLQYVSDEVFALHRFSLLVYFHERPYSYKLSAVIMFDLFRIFFWKFDLFYGRTFLRIRYVFFCVEDG